MDTDQLLDRVADGDGTAADALFTRHRERLNQMVRMRIDRRLAARVDSSDIVQDAIAEAYRRLPQYAAKRPIAFYPWLRRIAWDRLLQMSRHHIHTERRSVLREDLLPLSDESQMLLAEKLAAKSTSQEQQLRSEIRNRVGQAIKQLRPVDRELITLKHLEDVSFQEAAEILELSVSAVHSRYYRAIKKMHTLLQES